MRSQQQIESMLARFASEGDECDTETEAVRDALLWVLDGVGDMRIEQYLSES